MQFKSVCLGLSFGEVTPTPIEESGAAEIYAISFCAHERAHLSVFMAAPIFRIPSAGFVPLVHALVDEINAERRKHAEEAQKRIANAAAIAGVTVDFQIVQQSYTDTNNCLAVAARPCDIVIVGRPTNGISLDRTLIEEMLFTSGRPVIVIPPYWEGGAEFDTIMIIMIAWDGSARAARAARAVGDAMPLLTRAQQIEILCVSPDASKSVAGADLAAHLSRHCKSVTVTELQAEHRDVAKTAGFKPCLSGCLPNGDLNEKRRPIPVRVAIRALLRSPGESIHHCRAPRKLVPRLAPQVPGRS